MTAIPWTYEARADTRTTNIRLGMWLFLASEAMFFASLFSAFVLLRTGAASWPAASTLLPIAKALVLTGVLFAATGVIRRSAALSAVLGVLFLAVKLADYVTAYGSGVGPAENLMLASWYVMTGVHWLHVAGGVAAAAWASIGSKYVPQAHHVERLRALSLYWLFLDVVWVGIVLCFSL